MKPEIIAKYKVQKTNCMSPTSLCCLGQILLVDFQETTTLSVATLASEICDVSKRVPMECLAWRSLVVVGSVMFTGLIWPCWLCHLTSNLDYGEIPLVAYLRFQIMYYIAALTLWRL